LSALEQFLGLSHAAERSQQIRIVGGDTGAVWARLDRPAQIGLGLLQVPVVVRIDARQGRQRQGVGGLELQCFAGGGFGLIAIGFPVARVQHRGEFGGLRQTRPPRRKARIEFRRPFECLHRRGQLRGSSASAPLVANLIHLEVLVALEECTLRVSVQCCPAHLIVAPVLNHTLPQPFSQQASHFAL
jgi:hypothetical protein